MKHRGSFPPIGRTPLTNTKDKETSERTNERTDGGRTDDVRPSVCVLDGVWHLLFACHALDYHWIVAKCF